MPNYYVYNEASQPIDSSTVASSSSIGLTITSTAAITWWEA